MTARTKIVATLGPATDRSGVLEEMMRAGLDVVRLNLSHGDVEDHVGRLHAVRVAAEQTGCNVAVLADLPGPKVRTAPFASSGADLEPGTTVDVSTGVTTSTRDAIGLDYDGFLDGLQVHDRIVIGDGAIELEVEEIEDGRATCRVRSGGHVQGRPGVHLPSERLRLSAPTEQDLVLARRMATEGADFLAVSFVRTAQDIQKVRQAIAPATTRLVAKIETYPAIEHLEEIIDAADAVMVARGDLGIECPLEDVPHMQKQIVHACVSRGVPVITATQMLESMINAPSPTRAEVSDVANAVYDGSDAVMLSGETAIGIDPVNVIRTMARIAERAEVDADGGGWAEQASTSRSSLGHDAPTLITAAITHAAALAARDSGAAAILCCTRSGRTARAMARFRPDVTLIGLSPDPATVRMLALVWGVTAMHIDTYRTTDELVWFAVEQAVQRGLVHNGDIALVLAGAPDRPSGASTDIMRIVRIS